MRLSIAAASASAMSEVWKNGSNKKEQDSIDIFSSWNSFSFLLQPIKYTFLPFALLRIEKVQYIIAIVCRAAPSMHAAEWRTEYKPKTILATFFSSSPFAAQCQSYASANAISMKAMNCTRIIYHPGAADAATAD